MKLGICIYSNAPESVWNAFRLGNYSVKHFSDDVQVFLLGLGVEADSMNTEHFKDYGADGDVDGRRRQDHGLWNLPQTAAVGGVGRLPHFHHA
jgi:hypothetical protein